MKSNHASPVLLPRLAAFALLTLAWLFAAPAHALIGGSISCSVNGVPFNGYSVEPGAELRIPFQGNCQAIRVFPRGAALNHELYPTSGPGISLGLYDPQNRLIDPLPLGNYGGRCFNFLCGYMAPGANFSYTFYVVVHAPRSPGVHTARLRLGYTAIGYPNFAEWVYDINFTIRVVDTSCSLSSPSSVDLSFGSVSASELGNRKVSTGVVINCPAAKSAQMVLVPTQETLSAANGLSRTTLAGLNMQALWANTSSPLNLGSIHVLNLQPGSNPVNLAFKPQLEAGQSPAGTFQSQYTFIIYYP